MYAIAINTCGGEIISFEEVICHIEARDAFYSAQISQQSLRVGTVALLLRDGVIEKRNFCEVMENREYTPPMKRRMTLKPPTPDQREKILRVMTDLLAVK